MKVMWEASLRDKTCVDCNFTPEATIDISVNAKYSHNALPPRQRSLCSTGSSTQALLATEMRERVVAAANSRHPRSSARFFRFSTQRFLAASRRMPHNSIIAQQRQLYRDMLPRAAHTKVSNPEQAGPDFREVWNRIAFISRPRRPP